MRRMPLRHGARPERRAPAALRGVRSLLGENVDTWCSGVALSSHGVVTKASTIASASAIRVHAAADAINWALLCSRASAAVCTLQASARRARALLAAICSVADPPRHDAGCPDRRRSCASLRQCQMRVVVVGVVAQRAAVQSARGQFASRCSMIRCLSSYPVVGPQVDAHARRVPDTHRAPAQAPADGEFGDRTRMFRRRIHYRR